MKNEAIVSGGRWHVGDHRDRVECYWRGLMAGSQLVDAAIAFRSSCNKQTFKEMNP
jgi:hypothetical protein